jgi:hypothetical protein
MEGRVLIFLNEIDQSLIRYYGNYKCGDEYIYRVINKKFWKELKVTLRPTVSRSVHHGVEPHLGLMTRY